MVTDSLELVHFFKNIYVAHVPHTNNVATNTDTCREHHTYRIPRANPSFLSVFLSHDDFDFFFCSCFLLRMDSAAHLLRNSFFICGKYSYFDT
jgi:hypothetical protein